MKNSILTALAGVALGTVGCMGPIQDGLGLAPRKQSARSRAAASTTTPLSPRVSPDSVPAAAKLVIGAETLVAEEVWRDHRAELAGQSAALAPAEFQTYVQGRSVQLITDKVSESLLYQHATLRLDSRMVEAIEKQVDSEIRRVVTVKHDGIQRRYEKDLESRGQSLDRLRERLRREFVVTGYLEKEIKPKVSEPTRAALMTAYKENVESWRKPARRSMSLIDVRIAEFLPKGVDEPTREQWSQARQEAHKLIRTAQVMVQDGGSFADVARRYSHALNAQEGGSWGWVTPDGVRERYLPAVEALEQLQPGQVSGIIEAPDSFFLVRCDELEPGFEPDFESIQPELADRYFRIEYNRLIVEHVEQLRTSAGITPADLERFHQAVIDAASRELRRDAD